MPATYSLPSNADLSIIAQEYVAPMTMIDPLFAEGFCAVTNENVDLIEWEQEDNYFDLMQPRSLNSEFPSIRRVGLKRYLLAPCYYGEHFPIDERDIVTRRVYGSFGMAEEAAAQIQRGVRTLTTRLVNRMTAAAWNLFATGTYTATDNTGATIYTDSVTLTSQRFSTWSSLSAATPLADFRGLMPLARGKGCLFNQKAVAFMNSTTLNNLLNNRNTSDLAGKLIYPGGNGGGINATNINDVNNIFGGGDLPQIRMYDGGYFPSITAAGSGDYRQFTTYIPDNKVVIVGYRPTREPLA
ncbi:MAG: hypothetical protein EBR82_46295 [Caulobacteraceae bacterium]|nr:hypothetical protein [Caulobacteraceae bacterium]